MHITRGDVLWNYTATFLNIASGVILFPIILRELPTETVGVWTIFISITAIAGLLDFGFSTSFTRNVSYVFSGVKSLKKNGFETVGQGDNSIDYGLLKGLISAMRWFYSRMAFFLFFILIVFGTYYLQTLLHDYSGDTQEVYIAWGLLCIIVTYDLFTQYYNSLIIGKGLIKQSKQIIIAGKIAYLILAFVLIVKGFGLVAIVSAQALSILIIRWLSYRLFFSKEIKLKLVSETSDQRKEVLKVTTPNALKIGLTSLGSFLVSKSAIIIGSLYLSLEEIASLGITMQIISLIAGLAAIYISTYQPKIAQLIVFNKISEVKKYYLKAKIILFLTFLVMGSGLLLFADDALRLIGSQTVLIPKELILLALIISFLERNHAMAAGILLSKNTVPFFIPSLLSGIGTVSILFLLFQFFDPDVWILVVSAGIAQGLYQNWKWPHVVNKELDIKLQDLMEIPKSYKMRFKS